MKNKIIALLITVSPVWQQGFAQTNNSKPISEVLSAYMNLKNALVANDGKAARTSAKAMLEEIGKVPMDKMSSDQHTVWMKSIKKLSYDATHISETDEIGHHREHFTTLSKNLYLVVKAFPASTPVYYQFCPMANDNKGAYWMSEQEKISNPYYGNKMNSCSRTQETIQVK